MIIEVNTKLLHMQEQINLNQLFFLSVVLDKNQKSNQDVRKIVSLISDDEIQYLVDQNLISSTEEGDKKIYLPTEKLTDILIFIFSSSSGKATKQLRILRLHPSKMI